MQDHLHQFAEYHGALNRLATVDSKEKCKHVGCLFTIGDIRQACIEHDPRAFAPSLNTQ